MGNLSICKTITAEETFRNIKKKIDIVISRY